MNELWTVLDEPLADASIVPTYYLSKMTRKHVTVALAGEGGDELFGGYPTYQAHKLAKLWTHIPKGLRRKVIDPALNKLPVSLNNLSFDYKVKRFIQAVEEPPIRRHLRWMGAIPFSEQAELLINGDNGSFTEATPTEADLFDCQGFSRALMPDPKDHHDVVDAIMRFDMATYLPDDLLVKSDRASMAASLEVRLPFLAFPLVEFALSLPSDYKIRGLTTKYLLRKAAAFHLPNEIIKRPKKGFGIPVAKWINDEFRSVVNDLLSERLIRQQEIFHWTYVSRLLTEHRLNQADRRKELWALLMFQWWWRKFFMSSST